MTSISLALTLIHREETFTIPVLEVKNKCSLFEKNPELLISPNRVQSSISLSIFGEFVSTLEGKSMNVTATNLIGLESFSDDFGFSGLSVKQSTFKSPSESSEGRQIGSLLAGVGSAHLRESFQLL
jgi:hypothetical protein